MSANGFPTRISLATIVAFATVGISTNRLDAQTPFVAETGPQAVAPSSYSNPAHSQRVHSNPSHSQPLFSFRRDDDLANEHSDSSQFESPADHSHPSDDSLRVASHSEPVLSAETERESIDESEHEATANELAGTARRLAPQGRSGDVVNLSRDGQQNVENLPFAIPKVESLTTATAGLAIVVGLFLVCVTLLRKAGPGPTTTLPREAVSVLGRIPLAARHFAYLIHLGNKLVLVSISTDQVETIAEVTEPMEVDRLLGMCLRGSKHSTTADFQRMLDQLAKEPARGFLGKEATANRGSTT